TSPGRRRQREEPPGVPTGCENDVADHGRRRLVSVAGERFPAETELAARVDDKRLDAVPETSLRPEQHSLRVVERLLILAPARRADEGVDAVAQRDWRDQRPGGEIPPIPEVDGTDLVVHRRERRTALRVEEQRRGSEVVVRGRRQCRLVRV